MARIIRNITFDRMTSYPYTQEKKRIIQLGKGEGAACAAGARGGQVRRSVGGLPSPRTSGSFCFLLF